MSDFPTTLKRIRLEKKMSQEEFAKFLGTSKQNISRYESGEVSPKISTAEKMAERLNITLSELNGEYGVKVPPPTLLPSQRAQGKTYRRIVRAHAKGGVKERPKTRTAISAAVAREMGIPTSAVPVEAGVVMTPAVRSLLMLNITNGEARQIAAFLKAIREE